MRLSNLITSVALLSAIVWSIASAEMDLGRADGWHTWQIDEPGVSSEMCCFTWKKASASRNGCSLDGRGVGFTSDGDCAAAPGTVQVYVKFEDSDPKDIRVLSSNCPVSSESELIDHGLLSANENLMWFRSIIEDDQQSKDIREEALFGLVQSGGDAAYAYLDQLLSRR